MRKVDVSWLQKLSNSLINSITTLTKDPESDELYPNQNTRPVTTGHFVHVKPTPIPNPIYVTHSDDMCRRLGIPEECAQTLEFTKLFAANINLLPNGSPWATPYALSIYGQEISGNDPFDGHGYGDGRALSIGEFRNEELNETWELQWKGSGTTPFSRRADGRAVLRSSVREFLVSEAMWALRVPTTRALSLVASQTETVRRNWYKGNIADEKALEQNPKYRNLPEQMKQIYRQMFAQNMKDPDIVVNARTAITVRASPSFIRVGQCELFYRRHIYEKDNDAKNQLKQILENVMQREYPDIWLSEKTWDLKCIDLVQEFAQRMAHLTTNWMRVGFVQGNFNSDNCLVNGRTMDYGPFGFISNYDLSWSPWTGSSTHFAFGNQPTAGLKNLTSFAKTVTPFLSETQKDEIGEIVRSYTEEISPRMLQEMRKLKLGLTEFDENYYHNIWQPLIKLMDQEVDYTVFFRQLSSITKEMRDIASCELFSIIERSFYVEIEDRKPWINWLRTYIECLEHQNWDTLERQNSMNQTNPKYIPREWMLVEAYTDAENFDFEKVKVLQQLFKNPYDEQSHFEEQFYQPTPPEYRNKGGVSFYT